MLVIHDLAGFITGLQIYPETSSAPHIVVSDELFETLQPFVGGDLRLETVDNAYVLPRDLNEQLAKLNFNKYRAEKLLQIEQLQTVNLATGVLFLFGDTEDVVQTRDERDLININGVATQAMLLKNAGVSDPIIQFRAQSNTSYMLTPDEAISLGVAVAQHSQQVYAKAWVLKDAINAARKVEELELLAW